MYFIFVLKSTLFTKGRTSKQMQSRSPVQGVGRGSCDYRTTIWGPGVFTEREKLKSPIMLRNNIEITCSPKFRFKS